VRKPLGKSLQFGQLWRQIMKKMTDTSEPLRVAVDRLRPGIYVRLELKWLDHPFSFNSFKIRDQKQLDTLLSLGLQDVIYEPEKSDVEPLPPDGCPAPMNMPSPMPEADQLALAEKKRRIARVSKEREVIQRCEKKFVGAVSAVKNLMRNLLARPEESIQAADILIGEMVESLLADHNVAIHLMNDKIAGEDVYYHSLNVAVLAMMLGRESGLPAEEISLLGMGALFHDVGKSRIPDTVLLKTEPLNHAERALFRLHCHMGVEIAEQLGLAPEAIAIIAQHHETMSGKGYPRGLHGDKISHLARIVAIVNAYDNHCNCINPNDSLTPHEALALMFSRERENYDDGLLKLFIKCMGVYPPGSIVQLSNEAVGMVVSINAEQMLRPSVLIYDPSVPKEEAIIYDLTDDTEIKIVESIRPNLLLREIYDYLSPRKRMTYYFDGYGAGPNRGAKNSPIRLD
jgi:putative nucleotidyltransferase with HDIG domain